MTKSGQAFNHNVLKTVKPTRGSPARQESQQRLWMATFVQNAGRYTGGLLDRPLSGDGCGADREFHQNS